MKCRNCSGTLRTDFKFCPGCGARVAVSRLTFARLITDIKERFFNLENTFFKTYGALTVRPEEVISSYVNGVRRRYMNPMNYLGIALALSGIAFFAIKHRVLDKIDMDIFGLGISTVASQKAMDFSTEYHSFVFLAYIPVIAIAGFLSFNKKGFNLPEHLISAIYTLSQYFLLSFPIEMLVILIAPESFVIFGLLNNLVMFAYSLYVLVRLHRYPAGTTILRGLLYFSLYLMGYMGISLSISLFLLLSGQVSLEDFFANPS